MFSQEISPDSNFSEGPWGAADEDVAAHVLNPGLDLMAETRSKKEREVKRSTPPTGGVQAKA